MSNFPEKQTFLTYVRVSGCKKCSFFRKSWACFVFMFHVIPYCRTIVGISSLSYQGFKVWVETLFPEKNWKFSVILQKVRCKECLLTELPNSSILKIIFNLCLQPNVLICSYISKGEVHPSLFLLNIYIYTLEITAFDWHFDVYL